MPPLDEPGFPTTSTICISAPARPKREVTLTPGKHTLQLILGDKDHIPHTPPVMSERITVTVVDSAQGAMVCAAGTLAARRAGSISPT